jgi:hypothetical protein
MKKITVFLFLSLISSCGQNAFLTNNDVVDRVDPITGDQELHVSYNENLTLEDTLIGTTKKMWVPVENDGDLDITGITTSGLNSFNLIATHCFPDQLVKGGVCLFELQFKPTAVKDYSATLEFSISNGPKKAQFKLNVTGKGVRSINPIPSRRKLRAAYLNRGKVNYGTVYVGSDYEKLIYIDAIKNKDVKVVRFRSESNATSRAGLTIGKMACRDVISKDCFVSVKLSPKTIGNKKETLYIDYKIFGEDVVKTLALKVIYNSKQVNKCYNFNQKVHLAKNRKSFTPREASLDYPYFDSVWYSTAKLERTVNLGTTRVAAEGGKKIRFNEDTQVFFTYPVRRNQKKESIFSAKLLLNIIKFKEDNVRTPDTEVLCSADEKVCSGKMFTEKQFRKLRNKDYKVLNKQFSKNLLNRGHLRQNIINYYHYRAPFHLGQYLDIREEEIEKMIDNNKTMSFVIADDMRLINRPLLITSRRVLKSCQ